jgi:hypothetical protein
MQLLVEAIVAFLIVFNPSNSSWAIDVDNWYVA